MTTRLTFLGAVAAALLAAGCEAETGVGNIGLAVSALGSCPGVTGSDPIPSIDRVRVMVTAVNRDTQELYNPVDEAFKVKSSITVGGIPAGINNVVTVLGYAPGQTEAGWFARQRQVRIEQDATTSLDLVLAPLGRLACVTPPNTFTHRVFSTATALGDGTVLVTGGFTKVTAAASTVLEEPSDLALLYSAQTGGPLDPIAAPMTARRAAHAAVFLPITEKDGIKGADGAVLGKSGIVLLIGGANKVELKADGIAFATGDALNSYEIYDVATKAFHPALKDGTGNPRQMTLKRAFPNVARLFDNSVLITGGGQWPKDPNPDYANAELWAPWVATGDEKGGLQPFSGNGPIMKRQHNGAAIAKLEDTAEGLSRYALIGGISTVNADNPGVEIYTQSSQQQKGVSGVFTALEAKGLPPLFFPAVAPLSGKRFLVVGGIGYKDGKFQAPADSAWILQFGRAPSGDTVAVTPARNVAAGCGQRFFHTAMASFDGDRAFVIGGFKDFTGPAASPNCRWDPERPDTTVSDDPNAKLPEAMSVVAETQAFAGHRAEPLPDDTVLVVGGMTTRGAFPEETGIVQVYAPPTVRLDPTAP
ncbi:MAG: hypothetical protein FJ087_12740 [Deltaproteobacteria bacterium]|nr:hypothetical protein [Deltaproteobacteria bacterium]